jgi:hypothetical protein
VFEATRVIRSDDGMVGMYGVLMNLFRVLDVGHSWTGLIVYGWIC